MTMSARSAITLAAGAVLALSGCGHNAPTQNPAAPTTTAQPAGMPGKVLVQRFSQVYGCGPYIAFDGRAIEDQLGDQLPKVAPTADRLAEVTPHGDAAFLDRKVDQVAYYRNVTWSRMVDMVAEKDSLLDMLLPAATQSWYRFLNHSIEEMEAGTDIPDPIDGEFPYKDNPCF